MDDYRNDISLENIEYEIVLYLLKEKRGYVREISRSIDKAHSTVSRKLRNLVNENILNCEERGKNKVYYLKNNLRANAFIYSSEKYKLIKLLHKYPEMNVILQNILNEVNEKLVTLFGSHANLTADEDSDIDIYIEGRDQKTKKKVENIHSRINVKLGEFNVEDPLVREIINKHVILRRVERFYKYLGR